MVKNAIGMISLSAITFEAPLTPAALFRHQTTSDSDRLNIKMRIYVVLKKKANYY